ncbi:PAR1 [Dillenia turbinata]|uniref:PAR1 n=1 Tax=Dillenia turbinata TaxID=194707 RepID=A0AAN8VS46_9MAGN
MASTLSMKTLVFLALALALCVQSSLGEITCESLNEDSCAFAVSTSGKRCILEKNVKRSGEDVYVCRSSEIEADKLKDWIETDQCVKACGLDRKSLGISSDCLLEAHFTKKLCSSQCYDNCPNIVDLYFNLAAGEGVFLPKFCEAMRGDPRREMAEIESSGYVAPGPKQPVKLMAAPPMAPY